MMDEDLQNNQRNNEENEDQREDEDDDKDEDEFQLEDEDENGVIYKNDFTLIRIKCSCAIYLFIGILNCMTTLSYRIGSTSESDYENPINKLTYASVLMVLNIMTIYNILLLIYNKYINLRLSNLLYEVPIENSQVLYFIILPLTSASIAYFILAIYYNATNKLYYVVWITPIIEVLFYIAAVMLLIDFGGTTHTGEDYHLKIVTIWALFTTLIGVFNNCLLHLVSCISWGFLRTTSRFYNITYYSSPIKDEIFGMEVILESLVVAWAITVFCYLLSPAIRSIMGIERMNEIYIKDSIIQDRNTSSEEEEIRLGKKHISTTSLILGILFITFSCLGVPVAYTIADMKINIYISWSILCLFPMPLIFINILLNIFLCKNIKNWKIVENDSIVDRALMWIGFFGRLLGLMAYFIEAFDVLQSANSVDNLFIWYQILRIIYVILNLIDTILQILVIDLSLDRKPHFNDFRGSMETFNPVFLSFCSIVGRVFLGIFGIISTTYDKGNTFSVVFLLSILNSITNIMLIVYGLYIILYFGKMLHSIYK